MNTPKLSKRSPYSFTLRRALLGFAVLGVLLAGVRWAYVRVYTQAWAVGALQPFDVRPEYDDSYFPSNRQRWGGYGPGSFGPADRNPLDLFGRDAGHAVNAVHVPVPFRTLEEARQVNRILRHLPYLADVHVDGSDYGSQEADYQQRADEHLAVAIQGLPIAGIVFQYTSIAPDRSIDALLENDHLTTACWHGSDPPTPEVLRSLCAHPQLTRISCSPELSGDHLRVLANAQQLKRIFVTPSSADGLLELGGLAGCEVELHGRKLTDADLRDGASRMSNLVGLKLWSSPVTDAGLNSLAQCQSLKFLNMQDLAQITDEGILPLATLPRLEYLNLMGTSVTEDGVIAFCRESQVRKIVCPHGHDFIRLKASLPSVDIYVSPEPNPKTPSPATPAASPEDSSEDPRSE